MIGKGIIRWMMLLTLSALVGCSSDDYEATEQVSMPAYEDTGFEMELAASARTQVDADGESVTRGWTPPASFFGYDDIYDNEASIVNYQSLSNKTIDVFFTQGKTITPGHGRLYYSSSTKLWKLSFPNVKPEEISQGDYYVYGFIPRDAAEGATISLYDNEDATTYAKGAKLTIQGMPSVMSDACVIIGAKHGFRTGEDPDYTYYDGGYTDTNANRVFDTGTDPRTNRLQQGDFLFNLKTGEEVVNCMFLLFDHLCAALNISVKVHEDYDRLRTINLKKIHVKTGNSEGITKKTDVTVTLKANDTGTDPIENIVYTPTETESQGAQVYTSAEGLALTTTKQQFLCHFMPQGTITLILTCTYDVYDKQGNMTRKDYTATNTIHLDQLVSHFTTADRGKKYTVNVTVKPSYLYVLSEPDLDVPGMSVE